MKTTKPAVLKGQMKFQDPSPTTYYGDPRIFVEANSEEEAAEIICKALNEAGLSYTDFEIEIDE